MLPLSRATGCKRCGNTGYRGRLPLVEVAIVTPSIADMIAGGATAQQLQRAAISAGMAPLRDVAVARVRRGETTLQEIERVLGDQLEDEPAAVGVNPGILILNPDPAWRRMARAMLEGAGFRVGEAMDGETAVRLLGDGREFSFVISEASPDRHAPAHSRRSSAIAAGRRNGRSPASSAASGRRGGRSHSWRSTGRRRY